MFELRHEFGHAYNAEASSFREWISDDPGFITAYKMDAAKLSPEVLDEFKLSPKLKSDIAYVRDEVFAAMCAYATGAK
jgi:hypothetical protein